MQKETLKMFWRYSQTYALLRNVTILTSITPVVATAFIGPLILAQFMSQLQAGQANLANSWPLIMWFGITQLYGEVIGWRICLYACWKFETAAQRDLAQDVFTKLSEESLSFHANRFSGSLVSQSNKVIGSFERFWDTIIWQITPMITTILGAVIILSFYFWQYALFILFVAVIFAISVYFGNRSLISRNTAEAQASTKMSGYMADMTSNVSAVKAFGNESREQKVYAGHATEWRDKSLHLMSGVLRNTSIYSSLLVLINTGALTMAVFAAEHHLLTVSVAYLMLTYTIHVARQMWEMNSILRNYTRVMGDAHDMVEIFRLPKAIVNSSDQDINITSGTISFENVTFAHDNGDGHQVFDGFSLTIPAGQRVGIVGHSGSGKTTFTQVLLRFADVQSGTIRIDGQDISAVTQESLRRSIAYVPQEPALFHRSLRENIAYGKQDATEKEIIESAKRANAWDFIQELPAGLNTLVGERGVKLSGGQRQRIAIARAILKDASILILDEATSALDSESEKLIQASLTELMKDRTSVVIAHRLSTISKLDRIIVLDHGKVIEDGTHESLLQTKGTYARLWAHQSGGFIDE